MEPMITLNFTNLNIHTAVSDGQRIVWDKDANAFGVGWTLPEALEDLIDNYPDDYYLDDKEEDGEVSECGCPTYD